MADPISIIGGVGAIANLVDLLVKTTSKLYEIYGAWKDADVTYINIIAQLTAMRAALNKIQEWIDLDLENSLAFQLTIDLDVCISCCMSLVSKLDSATEGILPLQYGKLSKAGKRQLAFGNKNLGKLLDMLSRQSAALNLLLTACNCVSATEQRRLLEYPSHRRRIEVVAKDSASMVVQRDTASIMTSLTDSLSKLSRVFAFDTEVFASNVYQRAFRGSVKQSLRLQQGSKRLPPVPSTMRAVDDNDIYSAKNPTSSSQDSEKASLPPELSFLVVGSGDLQFIQAMKVYGLDNECPWWNGKLGEIGFHFFTKERRIDALRRCEPDEMFRVRKDRWAELYPQGPPTLFIIDSSQHTEYNVAGIIAIPDPMSYALCWQCQDAMVEANRRQFIKSLLKVRTNTSLPFVLLIPTHPLSRPNYTAIDFKGHDTDQSVLEIIQPEIGSKNIYIHFIDLRLSKNLASVHDILKRALAQSKIESIVASELFEE